MTFRDRAVVCVLLAVAGLVLVVLHGPRANVVVGLQGEDIAIFRVMRLFPQIVIVDEKNGESCAEGSFNQSIQLSRAIGVFASQVRVRRLLSGWGNLGKLLWFPTVCPFVRICADRIVNENAHIPGREWTTIDISDLHSEEATLDVIVNDAISGFSIRPDAYYLYTWPKAQFECIGCSIGSFLRPVRGDYRGYSYYQGESGVDDQKDHCPMRRAICFLLNPVSGAFEAICLGLVGIFTFRLGFYRDNEWRCVVGAICIFAGTVIFGISVARFIIAHI